MRIDESAKIILTKTKIRGIENTHREFEKHSQKVMKAKTYDGPLRKLRLGRLQRRSIELRLRHFSRRVSTFPWPLYASRLVRHRTARPSLCHHPSTAELARDLRSTDSDSLAYRFNTCFSRLSRWYGIGQEQNGTGIGSVKLL